MNFVVRKEENYSYIKVVRDRLNSFISPDLKAELVVLARDPKSNIIIDLSDCTSCDSSGLSALLVGNRFCRDSGGTFIICNLSPNVEKMIKLAMPDLILQVAINLEMAEKLLFKKQE